MGDKAGAQQCQQAIAVFGAQEVTWAGVQAAMQPVDPVQALDDAHPCRRARNRPVRSRTPPVSNTAS